VLDRIKTLLRDQLGLPSWVFLAVAGLASHVAMDLVLKKPVTSALGLLAPLTLGIAIEAYEIWVHYRGVGLFAEGNDPGWQILGRHGLDVLTMLALPLGLVLAGHLSSRCVVLFRSLHRRAAGPRRHRWVGTCSVPTSPH